MPSLITRKRQPESLMPARVKVGVMASRWPIRYPPCCRHETIKSPTFAPPFPAILVTMSDRLRARFASRRVPALVALVCSSLLAGCYSYRAAPPSALPAGAEVRLRITAEGAVALTDAAGVRLRSLGGRVQGVLADSAIIVLPADVTTVDGDELPWRRGALTVPVRYIEGTEKRTINRRRTAGFAAVVGAVFSGVVYYALKSIGGGGGATLAPGPGVPE